MRHSPSSVVSLDTIIPALRPVCRAYALGHIATTGPRLFGLLKVIARKDSTLEYKLNRLYTILKKSIGVNRFPATCAILIGGATAVPRLVRAVLEWLLNLIRGTSSSSLGARAFVRVRVVSSFLSALLAFNLLNKDKEWGRRRARSIAIQQEEASSLDFPNQHHLPPPSYEMQYAGKTMDLTLFALCRALDVTITSLWSSTKSSPRHPVNRYPKITSLVQPLADPLVFAFSASIIMWSWFYAPERLPKSYNKWISTAADIDPRFILALRRARCGDFVYGEDTGQAPLLGGLCRDLDLPSELGDPAKTIPIPCEIYHCGTGPSCEYHALSRFMRSWTFAMRLYLPLQLVTHIRPLLRLIRSSASNKSAAAQSNKNLSLLLVKIFKYSSISSSFLAAFTSLFYYSVCLARTRIGPALLPSISYQAWDSGLCVMAGCLTCGWSILLENSIRRSEIAQFGAPRALATLLPRVYDERGRWKEGLVFAGSVAAVLEGVRGKHVRGVLGGVLAGLMVER